MSDFNVVVERGNFDEWAGTYGVLVRAAIEDLLTDGPFSAELVIEGGKAVSGEITSIDKTTCRIGTDTVELENIQRLAF